MPDDQTTLPTSGLDPETLKIYQGLLGAGLGPGGANTVQMPQMQVPQDTGPPVDRSWTSRIGEALGGGATSMFPMSSAQREAAGNQALLRFGLGMLGAGPFRPIGEQFAAGGEGAGGVYAGYGQQQMDLAKLAQEQQATQLARIKSNIDLLNTAITMRRYGAMGAIPSSLATTTGPAGPGPSTTVGGGDLATIARDPKVDTAGQQANNPLNIQTVGGKTSFPGATGQVPVKDGSVVAFPDVPTGIAAASDNLTSYARQGINTVTDAVRRWVGPNAPASYATDVAAALGVKPGDKIDLSDPAVQLKFMQAAQPHETGKAWVSPDDYTRGIALAQARARGGQGTPGGGQGTTAAVTPPTPATPSAPARTAVAPSSPFGAGAFAPPATVTPAPAVTTEAPNVATTQPSVETPAVTAAKARARQTGANVPVEGVQGLLATPAGTLTLPGGTGGLGKRADVVSPILGGMQTAATTVPQPTTLAAGPAAGGGTTPTPAPAPAPATMFGGGAFATPPPIAMRAPAPAPVPPAAATIMPPAVPTPQTPSMATQPGGPPTFTYTPRPPPPGYIPSGDLTPAEQAAVNTARTAYTSAIAAAAQASPDKAAELRSKAEATLQDTLGKELTARTGRTQDVLNATKQWAQDDYNQQKDEFNQALASHYKIKEAQAQAGIADESKVMQGLDETHEAARGALDQLDLARALSQSAGDPTFWQQVQQTHPDLVRWVANLGGMSEDQVNQLGSAGALDAALNKLITMAKAGTGFTRPTNLDIKILTSQAPQGTDPQAWREAKLAYMQSYMQRQLDYVDKVRALRNTPGPGGGPLGVYGAQKQATAEQGDVVPTVPTYVDTPQLSAADARKRWAMDTLQPNTFYRTPPGPHGEPGALRIWAPNTQGNQ
jgi:hypothetical protein